MTKKITCIECPIGCPLSVEIENSKVIKVSGNKCPKGNEYAVCEIENPLRVLTSAVLTEGLPLKMVPVRTSGPIPKNKLFEAMAEIKRIVVKNPVSAGSVITRNFLNLDVDLIATRDVR